MDKFKQFFDDLPLNGFKTALGILLAVLSAYAYYTGSIDKTTFDIGMSAAGTIGGVGVVHKFIKALSKSE